MTEANSAKTMAVSIAINPARVKATNTADPAYFAATPVSVKTPEPMVFAKPSMTSAERV